MNELTYSQKIYLFAIYKLGQKGGEVKSTEVAKIMGVSKASTAAMTDKLCEIGYIRKEYYGQIAMTDSGVKAANSFFTSYILPFPNGESLTDFKKRCVVAFDKAVQKYKDKNAISLNDINVDILQKMKYYLYVTSENLCCLCTEPSVVILPRIFLETKVLLQKNPYKLKAQFKVNINP